MAQVKSKKSIAWVSSLGLTLLVLGFLTGVKNLFITGLVLFVAPIALLILGLALIFILTFIAEYLPTNKK